MAAVNKGLFHKCPMCRKQDGGWHFDDKNGPPRVLEIVCANCGLTTSHNAELLLRDAFPAAKETKHG